MPKMRLSPGWIVVVVFMMMSFLIALDVLHAHGRTESVLPSRAMPLGVDRTAYLYLLFIYLVSCMQCLVFWILDLGYIYLGMSVFFGN